MNRPAILALAMMLAGCATVEPSSPPAACVTEIVITATTRNARDHRYKPDMKPNAQLCVKGKK